MRKLVIKKNGREQGISEKHVSWSIGSHIGEVEKATYSEEAMTGCL